MLAAGQPLPAIDQLVRAEHWQEAARQLAGHCDALLASGRTRWLLCQLERLPEPWLAGYPEVRLAQAWALILTGRHAQALALAQGLDEAAQRDQVRCLVLVSRDQVQACHALGLTVLPRLAPSQVFAYGAMVHTLAYSAFALGRHDEARRLLSEAIGHAAQQGAGIAGHTAVMIETLMELAQGRLAMARARLSCLDYQGGSSLLLDVTRVLVFYETDTLDDAAPVLQRHLPRVGDASPTDALIVCHLVAARIACTQGDAAAGRQHLAALEQIGHGRASARILCTVWIERARIATLDGNLQAAAKALQQVERHSAWDHRQVLFYGNDVDTPTIARVRLDIARGHFAEASRVLGPAIAQAQDRRLLRRALKLRLLQAMALEGVGHQAQAFEALTQALRFASHEGWRSTFLEEGARMAGLLGRWSLSFQAQLGALGIAPGFACDLLARFSRRGIARGEPHGSHAGRETLTEREQQVVALLAQGGQGRDIARHLRLSEHTVKTHLRNLYRKLGANGRAQATAIARARGLLEPGSPSHGSGQQPHRLGPHHGLGTPGDPKFAVDVLDVRLDRVGRDVQAFADFPVGEPFGQQFQHADLTA
ncbi:HTH-type transcriptional regulator MalT [compost metagenome]